MEFFADLHIHSKYSIATSKHLDPEHLDLWARIKGIDVVGTGDFTHPKWTDELKDKLEPAEPGFFQLKSDIRMIDDIPAASIDKPIRFVLSAEISTIYKRGDKTRKVHHVILTPDFETVEKIQYQLNKIGNITSDGRPILGLDSRDLLEIALEANPDILFIPAHIWTPWFSALGDKSGFDSIEDCYGELAKHIYAIETGLSSDPPMNWRCSFLDRYTILSNSDAHSPEKLGREANLFDTELSYPALREAIKTGDGFNGTVEFYPEEGKYHYDGHRKCNVSLTPKETAAHNGRCPVCGKQVTVGVLNRVWQLADRQDGNERPQRHTFRSLIPLKEVLSEILNVGPNSKKVARHYQALIDKCGSEFDMQLHHPLDQLQSLGGEVIAEAVQRMRTGQVHVTPGYDGEFGVIKVFTEQEQRNLGDQSLLFADLCPDSPKTVVSVTRVNKKNARTAKPQPSYQVAPVIPASPVTKGPLAGLNMDQLAAAQHTHGPALIIAGPGTGKTRVLTRRIAHLIEQHEVSPQQILAVTFTNKAAGEMRERLEGLLKPDVAQALTVCTFHALGYLILREQLGTPPTLIDPEDKQRLLIALGCDRRTVKKVAEAISAAKQQLKLPQHLKDEDLEPIYLDYQNTLSEHNRVDLDDLICRSTRLLQENEGIAADYRQRFAWVLVDEYQDVNFAQYQMIRCLCPPPHANLCVIGDPNQAIYGFRGADVEYIERFCEDWSLARQFTLKTSYRCPDTILRASGQVVSDTPAALLSGLQPGVKLQLAEQASDKSEAEFIARTIEQLIGGLRFFSLDSDVSDGQAHEHAQSLSDFAVLVRTTTQLTALEKACNDHSIPYQVIGRDPFFKEAPVRTILDVARLALQTPIPGQREALLAARVLSEQQLDSLTLDPQAPAGAALEGLVNTYFPETKTDNAWAIKSLLAMASERLDSLQDFLAQTCLTAPIDTYQKRAGACHAWV
ncbi:UvrD-helicase domain-containing protein [Planctomycetota bacterium]